MTAFFKGIKYFFEQIAFAPYDYLRKMELSSWWGANIATWIMLVVLFGFFFYWVKKEQNEWMLLLILFSNN